MSDPSALRDLAADLDLLELQTDPAEFAAQLIRDHHERMTEHAPVAVVEVPCRVVVLDDHRPDRRNT